MKLVLIMNIIFMLAAAVSFIRGAGLNFKEGKAVYIWLVTCAVGCAFVSGLFETVQLLIRPDVVGGYQLGLLGLMGEFLFFFSANFGEIDSLGDDGTAAYKKYRVISFVVCALVFTGALVMCRKSILAVSGRIFTLAALVIIMLALFFHIKHLIIPDVEDGILKSIRYYNLIGMINCIASVLVLLSGQGTVVWTIAFAVKIAMIVAILPVLEKGVAKWTI